MPAVWADRSRGARSRHSCTAYTKWSAALPDVRNGGGKPEVPGSGCAEIVKYYICVTFLHFLFTDWEKLSILGEKLVKGGAKVDDFTRKFDFVGDQDAEIHRIMLTVYQALEEKGYNPINQIVGYILSEDPTYITNHNQARTLIRKVDRDELLQILVRDYLAK